MSAAAKKRVHELKVRRGGRAADCTCGRWSVELPAAIPKADLGRLIEDGFELHDSRAL